MQDMEHEYFCCKMCMTAPWNFTATQLLAIHNTVYINMEQKKILMSGRKCNYTKGVDVECWSA
jgi:hypothetical protein